MALAWDPMALPGLAAGIIAWTLAWFVYQTRPASTANRRLAVLIVLIPTALFVGWGLRRLFTDPADQYASLVLFNGIIFSLPLVYTRFLATIDVPLTRPLRSRWWTPAIGAYTAVVVAAVVLWPDRVFALGLTFVFDDGVNAVLLVYGLLVAISALLRAPLGLARRQARAYVAAFATRDGLIFTWLTLVWYRLDAGSSGLEGWLYASWVPMAEVLFAGLLSLGILRTQLFDLELKIKWTVRQSTVVAVFIAVFFLVSEAAAAFIGERTGSTYLGISAAALLLFFIAPLQRLAERVSDRAMPHVQDTDEYRTVRKREVYRAALEGALVDGVVSDRERDILARLQDQLGLSATEARAIEREATAAGAI